MANRFQCGDNVGTSCRDNVGTAQCSDNFGTTSCRDDVSAAQCGDDIGTSSCSDDVETSSCSDDVSIAQCGDNAPTTSVDTTTYDRATASSCSGTDKTSGSCSVEAKSCELYFERGYRDGFNGLPHRPPHDQGWIRAIFFPSLSREAIEEDHAYDQGYQAGKNARK